MPRYVALHRYVYLFAPSLQWVPWPLLSEALRFPAFIGVGSEEAPNEELASVRRTNRTYGFPVSGFHERAFAICSEGMSETRLASLNSVRNRLVGYSRHAALRHRLVRCDHSRRIIHRSS